MTNAPPALPGSAPISVGRLPVPHPRRAEMERESLAAREALERRRDAVAAARPRIDFDELARLSRR